MAKPSLAAWLGTNQVGNNIPGSQAPGASGRGTDDVTAAPQNIAYLLNALRSQAPGQWTDNLLGLANHMTGAVFLALNTMANQAASCEKKVYERTTDPQEGDLELPWTHPLCKLLENPNDRDGWPDFAYQISQQIGLTGMSLVWDPSVGINDSEPPSELYVIPTATALPQPISPRFPNGAFRIQPYYPMGVFGVLPSYQTSVGALVPAEQIIRIKNPHPLMNYAGYAVLSAIGRQVDVVEGIDVARHATMQKGVDPTVMMGFDPAVYDPKTTDLMRLRIQLESLYAGSQNHGKIMFKPPGATIDKLSNTPADMAWQEGWAQLVEFVLACYGVPKSVAGLQDATSFATLYSALRQFQLLSLNPHLLRVSVQLNKRLVNTRFGDDLYLQLTGRAIQDEQLLEEQLKNDYFAKIRKRNEVRRMRNLPPLAGPEGEELVGHETVKEDKTKEKLADGEPNKQDPDVERDRPDNPEGRGSKGPNGKSYHKTIDGDKLAAILDKRIGNGIYDLKGKG